jgi:carotenoid cleavage dioxygenase-like enzyme
MTSTYKQGLTTLEGEFQIDHLSISGQLPPWLSGSLVRNGPGRFEVGSQQYRHWFDGLSMLHRFTFKSGAVSYANKYLQSRDYREAMDRGRITVSGFATDPGRSIFQRFFSIFEPSSIQNGNVNLAQVADRYLAMTEVPLPMEFDLHTLKTLGVFDYGGDKLSGVLTTAHPHFDSKSQSLVNYTTEMGLKNKYNVYRIPSGQKRREWIGSVPVQEPAYMHSFGMTENFVILAEFPLMMNPFRLLFRNKPFSENLAWKPERGTRWIALNKRDGTFKTWMGQAFFAFHHINAFEQNGDLVLDIAAYDDPGLIDAFYLDRLCAGGPIPTSQFRRYRLPANGSNAEYDVLVSESIELPRLNYKHSNAKDYRFAYGVSNRPDRPGDLYNQLVKVDIWERTAKVWLAEDCYVGEPVFAAAPQAAAEDDGVILSVVLNAAKGTSFLLVLDAHSFLEIARAEVPHHIPFGFHGEYFAD